MMQHLVKKTKFLVLILLFSAGFSMNMAAQSVIVTGGAYDGTIQDFSSRIGGNDWLDLSHATDIVVTGNWTAAQFTNLAKSLHNNNSLTAAVNNTLVIADLSGVTVATSATSMASFFRNCTALTTVTFPNGTAGSSFNNVSNIAGAFQGCTSLISVTLPNSMNGLTNLTSAFSGCTNLLFCTLPTSYPANITWTNTFENCPKLTSLRFMDCFTTNRPVLSNNCNPNLLIYVPKTNLPGHEGLPTLGELQSRFFSGVDQSLRATNFVFVGTDDGIAPKDTVSVDDIRLTDAFPYDCPMAFTLADGKKASLKFDSAVNPSNPASTGTSLAWFSLAVPFDVAEIKWKNNANACSPYGCAIDGYRYFLQEYDSSLVVNTEKLRFIDTGRSIKANTPYLFAFNQPISNSSDSIKFFSETSTSAVPVTIAKTLPSSSYIVDTDAKYHFVPNYLPYQLAANDYSIQDAANGGGREYFYRQGVSSGKATVGYFSAYFKAINSSPTATELKILPDKYATDVAWTGDISNDWNDPQNWTPEAIPLPCTNVTIPGNASVYPVLAKDYTVLDEVTKSPECDVIDFLFGGEVKNTHYLTYNDAKVELKLKTHQWYMISPPLKNMYVGDFYRSEPNPFADGFIIEPMLFNATNPQTNGLAAVTANWSGVFNTPDVELAVGKGLAVWVNEIEADDYDPQEVVTFSFPKSNTEYYLYKNAEDSGQNPTDELDRTDNGKFIYDGSLTNPATDAASFPFTITGLKNAALNMVLVGNPFMAHLDFEKFAAHNSSLIAAGEGAEYKLPFGINTKNSSSRGLINDAVTFKKVGGVWCNTGVDGEGNTTDATSQFIAPMQSFIVTPNTSADSYTFNAYFEDTEVADGIGLGTLRSASDHTPQNLLSIIASRDNDKSKVLLLQRDQASSDYRSEEDSYKLFAQNTSAISLYMRSDDGKALDINTIGSFEASVPLCLRTSVAGAITLSFSGMESFDGRKIYFHDTVADSTIDLSQQPDYTFTKGSDEDLYLENRFFLSFGAGDDLTEWNTPLPSRIFITSTARNIHVFSSNSPLQSVQILDIQGRTWVNETSLGTGHTYTVPAAGIYIVRAGSKDGVITRKITVK